MRKKKYLSCDYIPKKSTGETAFQSENAWLPQWKNSPQVGYLINSSKKMLVWAEAVSPSQAVP